MGARVKRREKIVDEGVKVAKSIGNEKNVSTVRVP